MGVVFPHHAAGFEYKYNRISKVSGLRERKKERRKKKEEGRKEKSSWVLPYLLTSRGGMYG